MLTELLLKTIGPAVWIALASVLLFIYDKRRQRVQALERSYEIMQEFNTICISDPENIAAAIKSVCPNDTTTILEGRKIILQFMRINRMLRAWQQGYRKPHIIRRSDADKIVDSYIVTLIESEKILPTLLQRGYPIEFHEYLYNRLKEAKKNGSKAIPFNQTG